MPHRSKSERRHDIKVARSSHRLALWIGYAGGSARPHAAGLRMENRVELSAGCACTAIAALCSATKIGLSARANRSASGQDAATRFVWSQLPVCAGQRVPSDGANEQADLQNRDAAGVQLTSARAPAFCQTIALLANSLANGVTLVTIEQ